MVNNHVILGKSMSKIVRVSVTFPPDLLRELDGPSLLSKNGLENKWEPK